MRSLLFWNIIQCRLVISYRHQNNLLVLSSKVMQSKKMGTNCPKMSVTNYQSTYCDIPDKQRSQLQNYYFMGLEPYSVLGRRMKDYQLMNLKILSISLIYSSLISSWIWILLITAILNVQVLKYFQMNTYLKWCLSASVFTESGPTLHMSTPFQQQPCNVACSL